MGQLATVKVQSALQKAVPPAGTPKPVIDRLFAEFVKGLKNPAVIERLSKAGLEVAPSASPEAYGEFIRAEVARWPAIVKAAGIEPQ